MDHAALARSDGGCIWSLSDERATFYNLVDNKSLNLLICKDWVSTRLFLADRGPDKNKLDFVQSLL